MKTNKSNYYILCEIMYNLTGFEHWLNRYANERIMKGNFISDFHYIKSEVKKMILAGNIYRFPLFYLNGKQKTYIGNSITI